MKYCDNHLPLQHYKDKRNAQELKKSTAASNQNTKWENITAPPTRPTRIRQQM